MVLAALIVRSAGTGLLTAARLRRAAALGGPAQVRAVTDTDAPVDVLAGFVETRLRGWRDRPEDEPFYPLPLPIGLHRLLSAYPPAVLADAPAVVLTDNANRVALAVLTAQHRRCRRLRFDAATAAGDVATVGALLAVLDALPAERPCRVASAAAAGATGDGRSGVPDGTHAQLRSAFTAGRPRPWVAAFTAFADTWPVTLAGLAEFVDDLTDPHRR